MTSTTRTSFWGLPFYIFLLSGVLVLHSHPNADVDLWGHVKFGLDFLSAGRITPTDPYSYTAFGAPWIDHEWLSEIVFAQAYRLMSSAGLQTVHLAVTGATFAILIFRLASQGCPKAITGLLTAAAVILSSQSGFLAIRPQLFTFLLFACQFLILQSAHMKRKPWALALLPVIFVLWVNLHGGFLAGLAILYAWVTARFMQTFLAAKGFAVAPKSTAEPGSQDQRVNFIWLAIAIISTLSCAINPYGIELLAFLLRTATVPRVEIVEWHPFHLYSPLGAIYMLWCALVLCVIIKSMWRADPTTAFITILTLLLPFKAIRHVCLAAIASIILCAPYIVPTLKNYMSVFNVLKDRPLPNRLKVLVSVAFGAAACWLIGIVTARLPVIIVPDIMPARAVYLLKESHLSGNIACTFEWGEYCIWHLYPRCKVSVDGRRETVYSKDVYGENLHFRYGIWPWDDLLKKQKTTVVLQRKWSPSAALMSLSPDWTLVYDDGTAMIFLPKLSPDINMLRHSRIAQPTQVSTFSHDDKPDKFSALRGHNCCGPLLRSQSGGRFKSVGTPEVRLRLSRSSLAHLSGPLFLHLPGRTLDRS